MSLFTAGRKRKKKPAPQSSKKRSAAPAYERKKRTEAARQAAKSRAGRDIAPIPPVADAERKARGRASFEAFCREYFPDVFSLPWSEDHRKVIRKIENAILEGGTFAFAMPRGMGKTAIIVCGYLWGLLYGFQQFVAAIGSDQDAAGSILNDGRMQLETNELLAQDFPEVCHPIRMLEGITNRAAGQHVAGRRTYLKVKKNELVLPAIEGSAASSGIVRVRGLTGGFRGMKFTRPDGKSVRPGLILLDDPQTDESAGSPTQIAQREAIINAAVLGLAGPGKRVAAVMPCTIIKPDDLADRYLDRDKYPDWQGEISAMLYGVDPATGEQVPYAGPARQDLWDKYDELRRKGLKSGLGLNEATGFYNANREAMDSGMRAGWPDRKEPGEVSAIQHAMNLLLKRGAVAFNAEYQNRPLRPKLDDRETLTADKIGEKANGRERGLMPADTSRLVASIDVQLNVLFYTVLAVADDFTGHVIDYGTFPDQHREYFTARDAKMTLAIATESKSPEAAIYKGLEALTSRLLTQAWEREGGPPQKIELLLIDSGWGDYTDLIYKFCRESAYSALLMPSKGIGVRAKDKPLTERVVKPGDRTGLNWFIPNPAGKQSRLLLFDANYWKTLLEARWLQPIGSKGAFTIFGRAEDHRLFSEHLTSEYSVVTHGRGRDLTEWMLKPGVVENHYEDTVVGCAIAASVQGASLKELAATPATPRQRVKLSDLQKSAKHHAARAGN